MRLDHGPRTPNTTDIAAQVSRLHARQEWRHHRDQVLSEQAVDYVVTLDTVNGEYGGNSAHVELLMETLEDTHPVLEVPRGVVPAPRIDYANGDSVVGWDGIRKVYAELAPQE